MNLEHRSRIAQIRAADVDGHPGVTLHAIRPGVVDDYGSLWNARAFDESLAERLPTLCWAHDWSDPLGPATGYTTSDDGPTVTFRFSDFDAVPQARRAHAQVTDGTIVDCSVGFWVPDGGRRAPTDTERRSFPGVTEVIERAGLDEISLVLRGAVPGAKVLAVRTATGTGTVAESLVMDLAKQVKAGTLSREEALIALDLAAGPATSESETVEVDVEKVLADTLTVPTFGEP
jgi:HK97 family phage prohead protease